MGFKPDHEDFKDINSYCMIILYAIFIIISGLCALALVALSFL